MFAPIVMNINDADIRSIEKELFITFRKSLKTMLREEYYNVFGEVCHEPLSRKIMMSLKNNTNFNGEMTKQNRITNPTECAVMIANTVFAMFQILCSMQYEFDVKKHMKRLSGIVSNPGKGISAMERVVFAINTIYDISSNHEIFNIVQEDISKIDAFMERTFACEIDFD